MSRDHDALHFATAKPAALCTIVGIEGSFSRRLGAQLAVAADGTRAGDMADRCLDDELASQARAVMAEGEARVLRYGEGSPFIDFRLPCGSGLDILIDPTPERGALRQCLADLDARRATALPLASDLLPERRYIPTLRLVMLGAGVEVTALEKLATAQGIAIERLEAGADLALGRAPEWLEADAWTAVLLLFHDHEWEHALLEWAIGTPAFYIGAQGGAPARETRMERLRASGHDEAALARINSPVGLIQHARDPGVLALSILAEVVGAYEALHPHR
jgi:xanthine dehydrogenase accessory factor